MSIHSRIRSRRVPARGGMRAAAFLSAAAVGMSALMLQALPADAATVAASADCPWVGSADPIDDRAASVVDKMTLDEKLGMVHGSETSIYDGFVPGVPRLCIPALKLRDGPLGVKLPDTTQLPSATAVASSFDPSLAESYGSVIGAEAKTKGVNLSLGPTINIVRDPRWGRAFETYSEDPFLTAALGTADINGIQSEGTMAQLKHWALYNQETNRGQPTDNAIIDDRTFHEIYASAFEEIVKESDPSSVMCSYSWVNGTNACENTYLNTILKKDFGFGGFITSDWWGTKSTVAAANAGLDMEMPDDAHFGEALKTAIQNGQVPESRLNDMVSRILAQQFRFGLFENPTPDSPDAIASTEAHRAVAQTVAENGSVLLKNADGILPIDTSATKKIAVLGAGAGADTLSSGGGSATIAGTGTITPYQGIKKRAGTDAVVSYAQGSPNRNGGLPTIDSTYLTPAGGGASGLSAEYFSNTTLSGPAAATRIDDQVKFNWNGGRPAPGVSASAFSAKWTGSLTPPVSGTYTFGITSDDGSRLLINGETIVDNWKDQGPTTKTATLALTAGTPVQIEVDYYNSGGGDEVNLGWNIPGSATPLEDAVTLAEASDVAVVYANNYGSEGEDLANIDLPAEQNTLISAVAAVNPNTVVVLNTGSAVTMPWLGEVRGVIEAWYPGQQSGAAIASLLFGDVNPSGKLPVTFPASMEQLPAASPQQFPGVDGTVQYTEGLNVGYRWYDDKGLTPLFPFGFGLSYTTFEYSNLSLDTATLDANGTITAQVDVTNTGSRDGATVVQLYLSNPASGEPANQLKGFEKTTLSAGQTKTAQLKLDARDASYWNTDAQAWTLATGDYTVKVGDSSRNLPLSAEFAVSQTTGPRFTAITAPSIVSAGAATKVETTFTNGSTAAVAQAATSLTVPSGWTATASTPSEFSSVPAGSSVSTTWNVTAPQNAGGGVVSFTAKTDYRDSAGNPPGEGSAQVNVAYPSLPSAFNTVGITDDATPTAGNLDGSGFTFSKQSLADDGLASGAEVEYNGLTFVWPQTGPGQNDDVTAASQIISLGVTGGSKLGFLATATNGSQNAPVTIIYADGTTSTQQLNVADWWANSPSAGTELIATAHWNMPEGAKDRGYNPNQQLGVYGATLSLDPTKEALYVSLPTNSNLHVFAMASDGSPRPVYKPVATTNVGSAHPGDQVTVTGSGFAPDESVTVELRSAPVVVGTPKATAAGDLSFTFTVPEDTTVGDHTIVVTGAVSGLPIELALAVSAADPGGDGDGGSGGPGTGGGGTGGGTGGDGGSETGGSGGSGSGSGSSGDAGANSGAAGWLANTGSNAWPFLAIGGIALLAGVIVRRMSRARKA